MAYNQIEYDLLNHPWLSTETILSAYKDYFFALKEDDLKQIIEDVKNINFIDDEPTLEFKTQQNED